MRHSGPTRLVHRLGVTLLILELAHVPLPLPVSDLPSGPGASSRERWATSPTGDVEAGLRWQWTPIEPQDDADEDETVLVAADDGPTPCQFSSDRHFASPPKVRHNRHFLRGHSSKGLFKVFEERSSFLGKFEGGCAGLHPALNDRARTPGGAMLQRWRC